MVDKSNRIFKRLYTQKFIKEKELKHFSYDFKKTTNLGKLCLLPKIHKRLYNLPGRPVIFNCGTPTEKASEFLHFHLKPLMQSGWSYIRGSGDFIDKMKRIGKVPADVVGLYQSTPRKEGILALKYKLKEQTFSKIQHISGTAIGTKFPLPYACIYLDKTETDFLKTQELQPFV